MDLKVSKRSCFNIKMIFARRRKKWWVNRINTSTAKANSRTAWFHCCEYEGLQVFIWILKRYLLRRRIAFKRIVTQFIITVLLISQHYTSNLKLLMSKNRSFCCRFKKKVYKLMRYCVNNWRLLIVFSCIKPTKQSDSELALFPLNSFRPCSTVVSCPCQIQLYII